jgi:hypothetical protein
MVNGSKDSVCYGLTFYDRKCSAPPFPYHPEFKQIKA